MRKIILLCLPVVLFLLTGFVSGCTAARPLTLEEKAQDIYKSLMCPLCPGETVDQSQTELSQQMRAIVKEKLSQGASKEEILQFFKERYGESVLAAPTKAGFNLFLWIVPAIALVVGGFFLYKLIRTMQIRSATTKKDAPPLPDKERQYWEERIKAELDKR